MSVLTLPEFRQSSSFSGHDGICDLCGKLLTRQIVFWHLRGNAEIALHRKCAERFGTTLIYEARRAQAIAEGKSPTYGVATSLLKALRGGGREQPVAQNGEWLPGVSRRRGRR
jgi:hypothetical protein